MLFGTLIAVLVALPLVVKVSFPAEGSGFESEEASLAAVLATPLLPGDLVFRRGRSLNSRAVLLADSGAEFSHVAVVVGEGPDQRLVHTVPEGADGTGGEVVVEEASAFLAVERSTAAAIFRIRPYDARRARLAAREAQGFAQRRLPFDASFDLDDQESLYCTELVWAAYRRAGLDLTSGRRDHLGFPLTEDKPYILPSTLMASPWLERLEGNCSQEKK